MLGSAMFTIVESSTAIICAPQITSRTSQALLEWPASELDWELDYPVAATVELTSSS